MTINHYIDVTCQHEQYIVSMLLLTLSRLYHIGTFVLCIDVSHVLSAQACGRFTKAPDMLKIAEAFTKTLNSAHAKLKFGAYSDVTRLSPCGTQQMQ